MALVVAAWVGVPVRAVAAAVSVPGAFVSLSPSRVLDSRIGNGYSGMVPGGGTIGLQVTGRGGVPASGVAAVVLNTTVTDTGAPGFITVYPSDATRPVASNLNFVAGQTVANLVTVKVGANGKVKLFNASSQPVSLVADVAGYFVAGTPSVDGAFVSLSPARLLDSRIGNGSSGPVQAGGTVGLQVTGRGGVPASGVAAVVLNTTVTNTRANGYVTVYPPGTSMPTASNLNFMAGQTVANLVTVKLGADGTVNLANSSAATVDLVADVAGYYLAGTPTVDGAFVSVEPTRLLDSRVGNGFSGPVQAGGTVGLQVTGRGGVPASGVAAVVLNTTVTDPRANGYITAYPSGTLMPTASNLNFGAGQTIPNLVTVKLGSDGKVNLTNSSRAAVDLVADVAGYYLGALPGPGPTIAGISPGIGSTQGGDVVTITGTNLAGVTAVTFDGVAGSMVTPISDTQLSVRTPVHGSGAVDVAVFMPQGTTNVSGSFTFVAPDTGSGVGPLHTGIFSTTFWVGEIFDPNASDGSQMISTYDGSWYAHFGGCDGISASGSCETEKRTASNGYFPTSMTPLENPFYLDLPYDDVNDPTGFKNRCAVIPWANDPGYAGHCSDQNFSYMKNRWVKLTGPNGNTCYGQVQDAGPANYHDSAYVFGTAQPASGKFNNAGMDVSPALNGCLGFSELDGQSDKVSWQFVSSPPPGPWTRVVTTRQVS